MSELCNSCGASVDFNQNLICDFCGSNIEKPKKSKINIDICGVADTAYRANRFDKAINFYDQIIQKDKSNVFAWIQKGRSALRIGNDGLYVLEKEKKSNIRAGLISFSNALKFSKSKKIIETVFNDLNEFFVKGSTKIDIDDLELVCDMIINIKQLGNSKISKLVSNIIGNAEAAFLADFIDDLSFIEKTLKHTVNDGLLAKKRRVIMDYNIMVDKLKEFEESKNIFSLKEKYLYDENTPFILKKLDFND